MRAAVILVLAVLALVASVNAANPTNPSWPPAFSASVLAISNDFEQGPRFFRWFYSQTANMDRMDGMFPIAGELVCGVFIILSQSTLPSLTAAAGSGHSDLQPRLQQGLHPRLREQRCLLLRPEHQLYVVPLSALLTLSAATLPHPNFAAFQYLGQSLVDYQAAYHWYLKDTAQNSMRAVLLHCSH
jgi:hypothetical protein